MDNDEGSSKDASKQSNVFHIRRNIVTGILTAIPLWLTYIIFSLVFKLLFEASAPIVKEFLAQTAEKWPIIADWVSVPWIFYSVAVILTLVSLYFLGWFTSWVVGKKILQLFEGLLSQIPFVEPVYGSAKKLIASLQRKPDQVQRVVLIDFPSENMKTVGLVTATFNDSKTGRPLAAVYVPTTPNPTSGYLEIVPVEHLVPTNWNIETAMTFIISGGAVAPEPLSIEK